MVILLSTQNRRMRGTGEHLIRVWDEVTIRSRPNLDVYSRLTRIEKGRDRNCYKIMMEPPWSHSKCSTFNRLFFSLDKTRGLSRPTIIQPLFH